MCAVARTCYDRGWSWATAGNFSVRGHDGLIWMSPSGVSKGQLRPDAFLPVDLQSGEVVRPEASPVSIDVALHRGLYKNFPGIRCVAHAHLPAMMRVSMKEGVLRFRGNEFQKALGCPDPEQSLLIPLVPRPHSSPTLGDEIPRLVDPGVPLLALAGHGAYAWGASPDETLRRLEALEALCSGPM